MNDLATRSGNTPAVAEAIPEAIERALIGGDLGKLAVEQRLTYYNARCRAAGLNPITRPFEYILLNGRLVLYATKSCTDSLAGLHALSHRILSRETVGDIHEVCIEVSSPSGRSTQDVGAVVVARLQGEALANARMKAVTKAKRRGTLSFCGLGDVIDETELDTVRNVERCDADGNPIDTAHHAVNHNNNSGHGSGAYAHPDAVKLYEQWISDLCEEVNSKWLDRHTGEDGEIAPGVKELLVTYQLSGHMLKWAKRENLVNAPDGCNSVRANKFAAVAWERNKADFEVEARRYAREQWSETISKMKAEAEAEAKAAAPVADDDPDSDVWPAGKE